MAADLRRWGESLQPAYALGDFWSSADAVSSVGEQGNKTSIAVTYIAPEWLHAVRALYGQAAALGDAERVLADRFLADYRRDYFDAWARFLGRFDALHAVQSSHSADGSRRATAKGRRM